MNPAPVVAERSGHVRHGAGLIAAGSGEVLVDVSNQVTTQDSEDASDRMSPPRSWTRCGPHFDVDAPHVGIQSSAPADSGDQTVVRQLVQVGRGGVEMDAGLLSQ